MIILHTTEKLQITVTEENLFANKKDFQIVFSNRTYVDESGKWRCVSDSEQRPLYAHLRGEYTEGKVIAESEFDRMYKMFNQNVPPSVIDITGTTPEPIIPPKTQPQPTQSNSSNLGDMLQESLLKVLAEQSTSQILEIAKPMLEKHIIETYGALPQIHEIRTEKKTVKMEGTTHEKFDDVMNLVNLDIPVFLTGKAGTGKNVICKQVADALEMEFYFTNAVTQEYQLKGFIDANGTFHETQFYKAFTQGGLFFLDEMDGSIPETLIILNSAIANRYFDFPTGKVNAHENFRIISAGNTVGTGADIEYTGRFQLDASSLDRFALVEIGYSPAIEMAVSNGNTELCEFARDFRTACDDAGIRCLFTYRSLDRINRLESLFDLPETLKMSLTKGLGTDDIRIISRNLKDSENKYAKSLKRVK